MSFAPSASIAKLMDILSYGRAAGSKEEEAWIEKYLEPLNPYQDPYGNYWLEVGDNPNILWSGHTDTVHHKGCRQVVAVDDEGLLRLVGGKVGQCLGADDGAGLWLMLEMIEAKVPGLYVFHRDEESGGQGSGYIAKHEAQYLADIKFAIALDRRGDDSVITHQGGRCCSDKFARQLASLLGGKFAPDPTGLFTDTANYTRLIPECTNLSVGYERNHGPAETQDVAFLVSLRDKLCAIDFSVLEAHRDPSVVEREWWEEEDDRWSRPYGQAAYKYDSARRYVDTDSEEQLLSYVRDNPAAVAAWLAAQGVSIDELEEILQ